MPRRAVSAAILSILSVLARAEEETFVVRGTLVDTFTRLPVAGRKVYIREARVEGITDEAGRFRMAGVPSVRDHISVEGTTVRPGLTLYDPVHGLDGEAVLLTAAPEGGTLDVGMVTIDSGQARTLFAPVCEGKPVGTLPPAVGLLVLQRNLQTHMYRPEPTRWQPRAAPEWKRAQALVCIEEKWKLVGRYGRFGDAYRATWDVRLVRLHDRRVFKTRLVADPPRLGNEFSGAVGDVEPAFRKWLSTLPD